MSWKRWLLLIVGSLFTIVIMGAGLLAYLVLRLDVRAEVERSVEQATGRDVVIAGNVGVSFWPVLGLRAGEATLANVEGGRAPVFIAADEIDVGVELRPLLNREVVVRRLVLQRPQIALEVDDEGNPNWILTPRPPEGAPSTPPPGTEVPSGSASTMPSLRSIRINDGEISFFDARQGGGWVIGEADISTAITNLESPMQVEGSFRYNDQPVEIDARLMRPGAIARGEPSPLTLDLRSELLTASFDGQSVAVSGEIAGAVRATGPSLRQLAGWVGSPIQGGVGLEQFAVSGRLVVAKGATVFNAGFAVDLVRGRATSC
ncbi:MAG: AsmA family protein [Hyphomonadaceae bacterium]